MGKPRFWKTARVFVSVAIVLVGAANIGWNMYLLDTRPTVSVTIPKEEPDNWLCGKGNHGFGQLHCVLISERDRSYNLWMQSSLLLVIPFFLALAFWKQTNRPLDSTPEVRDPFANGRNGSKSDISLTLRKRCPTGPFLCLKIGEVEQLPKISVNVVR